MMLGQRLKRARLAAGLSLRDLQERIENRVTAQAIGKYERGESMPSSSVLMGIAAALDVPVDYVANETEITLSGVDFRKNAIASKREEAHVVAKVLQRVERYLLLEEILGLPSVNWDRPRESPYPVKELPEADQAATSLRQHWGLGLEPIPNLVQLLEDRGVKVLAIELSDVHGLTAQVRRLSKEPLPAIVVNKSDCGEGQRFTLAHELSHMMLDVAQGMDEEKVCHRFAGAFLMPAETLRSAIGKHRTSISLGELLRLKELFGVSIQALTQRCGVLGIFADPLFRRLFRVYADRGWRSSPYREPGAMPGENPKRFERLCYRALAEAAISEGRVANLLGLSVSELKHRMEYLVSDQAAPTSRRNGNLKLPVRPPRTIGGPIRIRTEGHV
jgi:Zn-dependent peptidase ImmA (M78 family)/DNA-binding XRE family transcriptional regulator